MLDALLQPKSLAAIASVLLITTGSFNVNMYNRCCAKVDGDDVSNASKNMRNLSVIAIVAGIVLLLVLGYDRYGDQIRSQIRRLRR